MSDSTFKFSTFLPIVNQTDTLVSFFGTTVDQLFQPGTSKALNGYIGEVPSYYNPSSDFYVTEPTAERAAYQLEPSMISYATTTSNQPTISNALTYPNFTSYLLNSGAVITNPSRLFENDYFSWAPPIDIDKISNYEQYVWLGDFTNTQPLDLPILTLSTPVAQYTATSGQTVFDIPNVTIGNLVTNPAIYQNGQLVDILPTGNTFVLPTGANAGDTIVVTPYNSLYMAVLGQTNVPIAGLVNCYVQYTGDGVTTVFAVENNTLAGNINNIVVYLNGIKQTEGVSYTLNGNNVIFNIPPNGVTGIASADVVTIVTYNGLSAIDDYPPDQMDLYGFCQTVPQNLSSGMIVNFFDTNQEFQDQSQYIYFIDGVGQGIRLTSLSVMIPIVNPQYSTIDRSSVDQNAWSLHNWWVHKDTFSWSGKTYGSISSRPIIEFVKDIILYNYGNKRIYVQAIMSQTTAFYEVDGVVTRVPFQNITGLPVGSVSVDNTSITNNIGIITEQGDVQDNATDFDVIEVCNARDNPGIVDVVAVNTEDYLHAIDLTDFTGLTGIVLQDGMLLFVNNGTTYNGLYNVSVINGLLSITPVVTLSNGEYFTTPQSGVYGGADVVYNSTTQQWVVMSLYNGSTNSNGSGSGSSGTNSGASSAGGGASISASFDAGDGETYPHPSTGANFGPLANGTFSIGGSVTVDTLVEQITNCGAINISIGLSPVAFETGTGYVDPNASGGPYLVSVLFGDDGPFPNGTVVGTVSSNGQLSYEGDAPSTTWTTSLSSTQQGGSASTDISGYWGATLTTPSGIYGNIQINGPFGSLLYENASLVNYTYDSASGTYTPIMQSISGGVDQAKAYINGFVEAYTGAPPGSGTGPGSGGTGGPGSGGSGTTTYQNWADGQPPLFYLFNPEPVGIPLDDPTFYPGSNFYGSKIFVYQEGTGVVDSVLNQPLVYDANGYIVFENLTVTERYTYNSGDITGLYCYGTYIKSIDVSIYEFGNVIDEDFGFVNDDYPDSGTSFSGTLNAGIGGPPPRPSAIANLQYPLTGAMFELSITQTIVNVIDSINTGGDTSFQINSTVATDYDNLGTSIVEVYFSTGQDYPSGVAYGSVSCSGTLTEDSVTPTWTVTGCSSGGCTFPTSVTGTILATEIVSGDGVHGTVTVVTPAGVSTWENVVISSGQILPSIYGMSITQDVADVSYNAILTNYHQDGNDVFAFEFGNAIDYVGLVPTNTTQVYEQIESLWQPSPYITSQVVNGTNGAFPTIPKNLQANPLNQDVSTVSLSDWYLQFSEIIGGQVGFTGSTYSANNYRDTLKDLSLGEEICQHRSPMLKAMLLSSAEEFDMPNAIRYAQQEYKKFKNKFAFKLVSLAKRGVLNLGVGDDSPEPNNPANWLVTPQTWVTTALNEIKANLNSTFPFSLSTMGGGNFFIPPTPAFLGVLPPALPALVTDTTYSNQQLFIRGHDGSYTPAFGVLDENGYSTDYRDYIFLQLEMNIYNSIPSLNANDLDIFVQQRLQFDVYSWMNNVWYSYPNNNGYSLSEINSILEPIFELWAQQAKYDYRTNVLYSPDDPFSWNYNGCLDRYGNPVPGYWRGIYNWYFDTDHPHTRPWEMLGFADMPSWWIGTYGTFYGSTNTQLWNDLEAGNIQQGPRQGIDPRYARPGLSLVIPVDHMGNLLDPVSCGIIPQAPTYAIATQNWVFGDQGPIETLWRTSSSYRYALAELGFYMKPPRFVELNWDTINYQYVGVQWLDVRNTGSNPNYLNRPNSTNELIHGELSNGVPTVVIGVQQWLVDNLINLGLKASVLGNAVRNMQVQLAHRMASFVSTDGLEVVSDTFGLVPSENVQIALYSAPAFDTETYSGVIVEWTGNGYRVIGYDNQNPYFNIFAPNTAGPKGVLSLSNTNEQIPIEWRPNTLYTIGINVVYDKTAYQCTQSHKSGATFNLGYWTILGAQPTPAPRVIVYNKFATTPTQIPYGTVLNSVQDVANFLLGWQAWLVSRGWVFDQIDSNTGYTLDWSLALREFLGWAQVSWAQGNFIALSPGAENLVFNANYGTVLNVQDPVTGFFGLLDRSGNPITSRNAFVSRTGGQVTLKATNADIFGARLRIAEVEHILVFSNTTIFDDIIYVPLFNQKQPRLEILANVSTNWVGRLSAPGYIVMGNDLVPNYDKNAEDIRTMFDIEKSDRTDFLSYARHNIGYQARTYMKDLLLSDIEQFEFFQGMIQAKGSPSVFERLLRSTRINENANVEFLEEWAVRQSHYGAPFNPRATFLLPQNDVRADPQFITFETITNASPIWIQIPPGDTRWLDTPPNTTSFFSVSNNPPKLPSAGPVRLTEVQYTSFTVSDLATYFETSYNNNLSVFNTGERVWLYKNNNFTWDVWRVFEMGFVPNYVTQVTVPSVDPTVVGMRIYFQYPLTLTEADIGASIVITNSTFSTPDLVGVQTITNINYSGQWIEVNQTGSSGHVFDGTTPAVFGRIFRSVRYATTDALNASIFNSVFEVCNACDNTNTFTFDELDDANIEICNASDHTDVKTHYNSYWITGDIVWVDNDYETGLYTVQKWNGSGFVVVRNQPVLVDPSSIITSTIYENGSKIVNSATSTGQVSMQNAKLISDNPLVDDLVIIDPIAGFISGVAEREIAYQTDIDPAAYNVGDNISLNPWGANQVGQVWWDLSTCRYLEYYTDLLGVTNTRDITEISHRIANWGMIAPNSSIDVYEWVQSSVPPSGWAGLVSGDTTGTYSGTVYSTTSYVQTVVFNVAANKFVSQYYFWVTGKTSVPNVSFRTTDIATVASILTNPSAIGTPWIAPVTPNGLLVAGVHSYLDNTSSTLMVEISNIDDSKYKTHAEWVLIDQNNEISIPPAWLSRRLRDSLGGFTYALEILPDPTLSTYRNIGILPGQNMFDVTNGGLLDARQSYVGIINNIFAQTPIMQNLSSYEGISRSDTWIEESPIVQNADGVNLATLQWNRQDISYPIIPPPETQYTLTVYSLDERNRLLTSYLLNYTIPINVLIDGRNTEYPYWSIWTFNPSMAQRLTNEHGDNAAADYLYTNASEIFSLATAYDVYTDTYADMIAGNFYNSSGVLAAQNLKPNQRVYVQADETADGFWTVYNFLGNGVFKIAYAQLYRTSDFYNVVDWYAQNVSISGASVSFSASSPPTVNYLTVSQITSLVIGFNPTNPTIPIANATIPNNQFVSVGSAESFEWYAFDTTINAEATANAGINVYNGWVLVAQSGSPTGDTGTIALSENFYTPGLYTYGLNSAPTATDIANIANRDGSWEIKVLFDAINYLVLSNIQINEVFFSMVHFVHTQQNAVDWIFKTSFMTIGSFSIPLTQTGILVEDPTSDLVDYINEVKPYRVKIRDYSQQYSIGQDQANTSASDFDLPVYYDSNFAQNLPIIGTVAKVNGNMEFTLQQLPYTALAGNQAFTTYTINANNTLANYPWGSTAYHTSWAAGTPYSFGDTVVYNGVNYECINANSDVTFTPANWYSFGPAFPVGWYTDFISSTSSVRKNTIKLLFDRVVGGPSGYAIPPYSKSGFDSGNQFDTVYVPWQAGNSYSVGDIVNYGGITNYQCKTANNSQTFNLADWTLLDPALVNQTAAYRLANYYDGTAINQVLSFSYGKPDPMNLRQKGNEIDGDDFLVSNPQTIIIDGGNISVPGSGTNQLTIIVEENGAVQDICDAGNS